MNYMTNPNAVRIFMFVGAFLFLLCFIGFGYAVVRLRRGIAAENEPEVSRPMLSSDGLAFAAFQQTITDLKQSQRELENKARAETQRANSSEALTRTLLDNLSTPAIAFNPVGLVKQANPAARELFGYTSPVALSVNNLFDTATFVLPNTDEAPSVSVVEVVRDAFRGSAPVRDLRIAYTARTMVRLTLDLTIVPQNGGGLLLLTPVTAEGACTHEVPPCAENPSSSTAKEG
jgi:PAS domain-containing protein